MSQNTRQMKKPQRGIAILWALVLTMGLSIPASADPEPVIEWRMETGGPIWAPAVSDRAGVYVGSTDGAVYAMEATDGRQRWKYQTEGPIFSGAEIVGEYLYVTSDDGFLYKLTRDEGTLVWRTSIHNHAVVERIMPGDDCCSWDYRASSPRVSDDVVYLGSADRHFYALSTQTGEVLWSHETGAQIRATPAFTEQLVIFGGNDGEVRALDRKTGRLQWLYATEEPIPSSPLIHGEKVIIGSRDAHLYALAVDDGKVLWQKPYADGSWVESSAVAADNSLYVGSSDWRVLLALNPEDGSTLWQAKTMDGGNLASPAVKGDAIYQGVFGFDQDFMPESGLVKIDRDSGREVWRLPMENLSDKMGHGLASAPIVTDNLVLFGALDGSVYALKL